MRLNRADWFFITGLLLLSAGLRFVGLSYGQPDPRYMRSALAHQLLPMETPIHPDEYFFVAMPLQMVLTESFNPTFFENPNFLINTNFVTFLVTGAGNGLSHEDRRELNTRQYAPFHLYVIGRVYSALGGLVAVAATYATTRLLAGRFAGAVAGLLVAVSFPMVQHAHYTTTSSLAAGFTMVAIWASVAFLQRERWPMFALAGISAGFAAGNRYNAAGVAIVLFLLGLIVMYRRRWARPTVRSVLLGWALVPAAFVFSTPYLLVKPQLVMRDFLYILGQFTSTAENMPYYFLTRSELGLLYEYRYLALFGLGVPATLAACVGVYAAWSARPRGKDLLWCNSAALVVAILLVYLAAYSLVVLRTLRPTHSEQLLVPVIPQFALLAGLGAGWLYERLPQPRRWLSPTLALLLVIFPLIPSVQLVHQFAQPDTRQVMQAWVYQHLPWGSRVHLHGSYNVPLDPADYEWTQTYMHGITGVPVDQLRAGGIDYVIYSDAWLFDIERAWEVTPADLLQGVETYVADLDHSLTPVARIERPIWFGYDWMMMTARLWHNPSLTVYCLSEESCAAVRP